MQLQEANNPEVMLDALNLNQDVRQTSPIVELIP